MSLYIIYEGGVRFWIAATPQCKRIVTHAEAAAIFYQMQAGRAAV